MKQFSKTYVAKCIQHGPEIQRMIDASRECSFKVCFQPGDYFHCPGKMNSIEVKKVEKVLGIPEQGLAELEADYGKKVV